MTTLFIDWQPHLEAFRIGSIPIRWYSLCWVVGIALAYVVVMHLYRLEGIDPAVDKHGKRVATGKFDPLLFYCFIGSVLGARLGHCIFYEPEYYLTSLKGVVEMFLPVKFASDSWAWHFTGYAGLASHGGTLGLFLMLLLYIRQSKLPALQVLDIIALAAPLPSCCIRLGNLMNSEIIGSTTQVPWAFIFHSPEALLHGQLVPRHPAQLYEALAYLLIFVVGWWIYRRRQPSQPRVGSGFYFGFCLATIFIFRFFVEFLKEVQGGADDGTTALDMGQMLSLPFVAAGIFFIVRALRQQTRS